MKGYLYVEEELLGRLNGTYVKRYFITYKYCGIKWFLQKPSNVYDLNNLQYLVDDSCGWLYGGTIIPHSVESSSIDNRYHDGVLLYLFKLIVKSQNSFATVILAADSENDRQLWIEEIKLSMRHLIYVSICMKSDYVPKDVLFQMIQHRFDEYLYIHDITVNNKIINIIFDFYMVMMPHGFMLEAITFDNTHLNDSMLKTLCLLVSHALYLKKLSITRNAAISSDGMTGLLHESIKSHKFLVHLDVSFNNLDDRCMPVLAKTIEYLVNLQYLDISHNLFTSTSTPILSHRLATFQSKLTHLNVSHNSLGDGIATAVSILLLNQPSILQQVNLSFCALTENGINEVSLALKSCSTLKSISLYGSFPESTAIRSLVKAITTHHETYGGRGGGAGMSLRLGGIVHEMNTKMEMKITHSLSLQSLKASFMYTSDIAHLKEVVMRKRLLNGNNIYTNNKHHHYPVLSFIIKLPSFLKSTMNLIEELAIYMHCDPSQFMMLSSAKIDDPMTSSGLIYKLVFTIIDVPTDRYTARQDNSYLHSIKDVFGIDTHVIMKEYVKIKQPDNNNNDNNDNNDSSHHFHTSSSVEGSNGRKDMKSISTLPPTVDMNMSSIPLLSSSSSSSPSSSSSSSFRDLYHEKSGLYNATRICSASKLLSTMQYMAETSDPFLRFMGITAVDMHYIHHSTIDWVTPEYVNVHAIIRNPSSNGRGVDDAYVYAFTSRDKVDGTVAAASSQLNHSFPFEDTDDDDCIDTAMHTIIEQKELHNITQTNEMGDLKRSNDQEPSANRVIGDRHDVSRAKNRTNNERLIHAVRELYKTGEAS